MTRIRFEFFADVNGMVCVCVEKQALIVWSQTADRQQLYFGEVMAFNTDDDDCDGDGDDAPIENTLERVLR